MIVYSVAQEFFLCRDVCGNNGSDQAEQPVSCGREWSRHFEEVIL